MVKMVSLMKSKTDKDADDKAGEGTPSRMEMAEPEGLEIHLTHEHLKKLGLKKPMETGSDIDFHGTGTVTSAHSEEVNGEMRHRMAIRLEKAEPLSEQVQGPANGELRGQIEDAHGKSAEATEAKAQAKIAKKGDKADKGETY